MNWKHQARRMCAVLLDLFSKKKEKKPLFKASHKEKKNDQALSGLERDGTTQTLMSFASLIRSWF